MVLVVVCVGLWVDVRASLSRSLSPSPLLSPPQQVKIVDPALNFRNFGGHTEFSGQIETIKAYESNPAVKKAFAEKGEGRVLVVDAGGSMRCAMLGDMIAEAGTRNGWAGKVPQSAIGRC
jgi:regulator of ribonuclease activity A